MGTLNRQRQVAVVLCLRYHRHARWPRSSGWG
jgi:hypothetical protein